MSKPLVMIQATVLDGPFAGWIGPLPHPDLPPEVRRLILVALGADAATPTIRLDPGIAVNIKALIANTDGPQRPDWRAFADLITAAIDEAINAPPDPAAAELRAIAEEIADTAPRLLAADQWACDRLSDLVPRLTAVANRLEE